MFTQCLRPAKPALTALHVRQVCVIGAGKMSRLLFKHMAAKGCTRAVLLNRTLPRAQAMAEEFPQVQFRNNML